LVRIISDRERSKVYLAKDLAGGFCAIKFQWPSEAAALPSILSRYNDLQPLTAQLGLLQMLAHGVTPDGWVWESLHLADNLPGLPALTEEAGIQQYTPLTLRAWSTEHGPASAKQVAEWGIGLVRAITALHKAGLVHRDVKPTNILLIRGEPCLGDFGLVGEPGGSIHFAGTEGFQPAEGTSDVGADLFALGKTLYEVWTGGDRLEFPSVPRVVLDSPEWSQHGIQLNEVILRACHAQSRQRFHSAAQFAEALSNVVSGRRPLNRRRWLVAAGSIFAIGAGTLALLKAWHPPARIVWRRVRQKGFEVEAWYGHAGTVDWKRRRMYSLTGDKGRCIFNSLHLDTFELATKEILDGPKERCSSIFHPETRQVWAIEGGRGEVFALDPDSGAIQSLGGGPNDLRHYYAATYWNPITRRVGVFGGYGMFAVNNDRSEFDAGSRRWVELEPNRRDTDLWPREPALPFLPDARGKRLFMIGGQGNPSGEQGERVEGLRGFFGHFHRLDDIWELNLETRSWRRLLPLGQAFRTRTAAGRCISPETAGPAYFSRNERIGT
jgi:serine/threonine protein kinase